MRAHPRLARLQSLRAILAVLLVLEQVVHDGTLARGVPCRATPGGCRPAQHCARGHVSNAAPLTVVMLLLCARCS